MQKLAMNALGDTVVAHDDVLFCGGDSAEAAYFVQSGRLKHGGIVLKTHSWSQNPAVNMKKGHSVVVFSRGTWYPSLPQDVSLCAR